MDLGPHAIFIWLCYAAVAVVLVAMMAGLWLEGRRLDRELARLDSRRAPAALANDGPNPTADGRASSTEVSPP